MTDLRRPFQGEALLTQLIEALPEPAFVIDESARIIVFNAAARAILPSMRQGDPITRGLRSPDVLDALNRVLAGGVAEKALWLERVPVEYWFEVYIAPLHLNGYGPAAVTTLRDMTEARRVERMRVDFVANASHELRTPLASLLGFVETLQGPAKEDAQARSKFLTIMREQAQRMARLVDDLLSFRASSSICICGPTRPSILRCSSRISLIRWRPWLKKTGSPSTLNSRKTSSSPAIATNWPASLKI